MSAPIKISAYERLSRYRSELMGIAMLWVLLFHAYHFQFDNALLDIIKDWGFGGVDIFIMLSGLGLHHTLVNHPELPVSSYYKKRVCRLMPAYWLVVGAYSLLLWIVGRIPLSVVGWNLSTLHYWFHIPGSFNWYVPAMLAFYLLSPAYEKLFEHCRYKELLTMLSFPAAYGIYRLCIPIGIHYTEDFINRIPAMALGFLAGYYLDIHQKLTWKHIIGWTALGVTGVILHYLWVVKIFYISPCYILDCLVMPVCLLLSALLEYLPGRRIHVFLRLLGTCSLEIYLLNVVVTREFWPLTRIFDYDSRHVVFYVLVYALNIVFGVVLHYGIENVQRSLKQKKNI